MKKLLCIFAAAIFIFSGCGKNNQISVDNETKEKVVNVDYIYNNIIINYINIGGLTKEQAKAVLNEKLHAPLRDAEICFINPENGETVKKCSYLDMGVSYDIDGIVDEAYAYGRTGTLDERYATVCQLVQQSKSFEYFDRYTYNEEKISALVDEISKAAYKKPEEPVVEMQGNKAVIVRKGKDGYEVDKEKLNDSLTGILDDLTFSRDGEDIFIPINTVSPSFTENDVAKIDSELGSFSSRFSGSMSQGRNVNMNVAASKINGVVIMPDEIFSTNEHFGSSSAENGYVNAPVIVEGELQDGIGGGVCQVSSTLYNAVLYSELEVVQRQNHSLKVGYADYGFDATLADDAIDFRFKNNTDTPIIIKCNLANNRVNCAIYGHETRPVSRTLKFKNELVETTDTSVKYNVYKLIYENGELKEKVKVNTSTYKLKKKNTTIETTTTETTTQTTTTVKEQTTAAQTTESKPVNAEVKPPAAEVTTSEPTTAQNTQATDAPVPEDPVM